MSFVVSFYLLTLRNSKMLYCDDLVLPISDAMLMNLDEDELLILFVIVLLMTAQSYRQQFQPVKEHFVH